MQFMVNSSLFLNGRARLRSGWRFAIFLITFIIWGLIFGAIFQGLFGYTGGTPNTAFFLVSSLFSLAGAIGLGYLFGKFLDGVPFRALGFSFSPRWAVHFFIGSIVGVVTLLLAVGIAVAGAGYGFRPAAFDNKAVVAIGLSFLVFAIGAAFEEALFRGYILQTFARAGLAWLAILLTAVFFGLVHLGNPGANAISTINTSLAGVWFGIAYLKSRDLWFPFAIHLMWNWTQGSIFGIEVSGLTDLSAASLFHEIDRGPDWITGGDYGIEAGISTTVAILISIAVIYLLPLVKADDELVKLTSEEMPIRSTGS
jgi:membrane protease YdiL (CAAX protease family)